VGPGFLESSAEARDYGYVQVSKPKNGLKRVSDSVTARAWEPSLIVKLDQVHAAQDWVSEKRLLFESAMSLWMLLGGEIRLVEPAAGLR
jgi:hypothetical protein